MGYAFIIGRHHRIICIDAINTVRVTQRTSRTRAVIRMTVVLHDGVVTTLNRHRTKNALYMGRGMCLCPNRRIRAISNRV